MPPTEDTAAAVIAPLWVLESLGWVRTGPQARGSMVYVMRPETQIPLGRPGQSCWLSPKKGLGPDECHQDRQLFSPLQRAGGRHCVHQGHLVCGRVGHRPSAGRPLVWSGLMCFEPPGGLCGGAGGGHDTCAQKRVRNSYQVRRHHTVLTQSDAFPPSLPPAPCFPPSPSEICTYVELDPVAQLLICHRRPPAQDPGPALNRVYGRSPHWAPGLHSG